MKKMIIAFSLTFSMIAFSEVSFPVKCVDTLSKHLGHLSHLAIQTCASIKTAPQYYCVNVLAENYWPLFNQSLEHCKAYTSPYSGKALEIAIDEFHSPNSEGIEIISHIKTKDQFDCVQLLVKRYLFVNNNSLSACTKF